MSARIPTRVLPGSGAVVGNTARALMPEPARPAPRRRTPLSLVPAAVRKRRVPFSLFCIVPLMIALGLVLVLNISVSGGQYELVKLRNQQVALAQDNEALTQRAENLQAPQNLAAKAADLGMVNAASAGSIDLSTLSIGGQPAAADVAQAPTGLIARPAEPGQNPAAEQKMAEQKTPDQTTTGQKADAGTSADAPPGTTDTAAADAAAAGAAAAGEAQSGATADEETEPGAAGQHFAAAELNGGSIPAPKQKAGN